MSGLHRVTKSLESRWTSEAQSAAVAAELDYVLLYPLGSLCRTGAV